MSVICTVESTQCWQQLCKETSLRVFRTVDSDFEQIDGDVVIEGSLSPEALSSLINADYDVTVVIPPPHMLLQQATSADMAGRVKDAQALLEDLLSLYKKNRSRLKILPLSAFGKTNKNEVLPRGLQELSFDATQLAQNIDSVICHSLIHQNLTLLKTYKKLESCFLVSADDGLLFPDLNANLALLQQEAMRVNDVEDENTKLLEQVQLVLAALESKADDIEVMAKELGQQRSENVRLKAGMLKETAGSSAKEKRIAELESDKQRLEKAKDEVSARVSEAQNALANVKQELKDLKQDSSIKDTIISKTEAALQSERSAHKETEKQLDELNVETESAKKACTVLEKQKSRELKKLESKLASKAQLEYQLRAELAELRAIKQSKLWKVSSRMEKLSNAVDKSAVKRRRLTQDIGLLYTSELFDTDWYLETYSDVLAAAIDPAEHYLLFGAKEGRRPSPQFDGNWYLKRYPDVAEAQINPLLHYIKYGRSEGRSISPVMITFNNK